MLLADIMTKMFRKSFIELCKDMIHDGIGDLHVTWKTGSNDLMDRKCFSKTRINQVKHVCFLNKSFKRLNIQSLFYSSLLLSNVF